MSVLIKGMDAPGNCDLCIFDNGVSCMVYPPSEDMIYDIADGRPDWCPLIPVPDHGDLIDRDKLEKDIDNYIGGEESRSRFHHWVQVQNAVIPMDKGEEK